MMPRSPKQEAPSASSNHGSTGDEAMDKSKLPATEGKGRGRTRNSKGPSGRSKSLAGAQTVPRILKYMYQRNCSQRASDEQMLIELSPPPLN